ncbi:hypothetical protein [Paenibacillus sp. GP183]|uniref:hypothetical protein n=1 Tax=Paenibacillus sp. GP183 TaxID=1882751 RepID=UPI00111518B4|nr:hypothetical protein [Paenibacillus sp. GP183]
MLKKFEEEVDFFYGLGGETILRLNILISWHSDKVGRTDPEINEVLRQIHSYSFETMDRLNKFQKNIQNEFLGKIYNGKLQNSPIRQMAIKYISIIVEH